MFHSGYLIFCLKGNFGNQFTAITVLLPSFIAWTQLANEWLKVKSKVLDQTFPPIIPFSPRRRITLVLHMHTDKHQSHLVLPIYVCQPAWRNRFHAQKAQLRRSLDSKITISPGICTPLNAKTAVEPTFSNSPTEAPRVHPLRLRLIYNSLSASLNRRH